MYSMDYVLSSSTQVYLHGETKTSTTQRPCQRSVLSPPVLCLSSEPRPQDDVIIVCRQCRQHGFHRKHGSQHGGPPAHQSDHNGNPRCRYGHWALEETPLDNMICAQNIVSGLKYLINRSTAKRAISNIYTYKI